MQRFPIRSLSDVQAISRLPYSTFMAHDHVYNALEAVAFSHPNRRALSYVLSADLAEPAQVWTYAALLGEIRQAARLFQSLAGADEPRVAMLLPAIPEAHLTLWGAEAAGVVCPINFMLDSGHIADLLRAARINILVALGPSSELDIWSRVSELSGKCPDLKHILSVGTAPGHANLRDEMAKQSALAQGFVPYRSASGLAALFHTGGTTGAPKLAQHTHANQLHSAWSAAQMYAMTQADVILNGFPVFHVAGAFVYGLSTLLSGAEIVLPTLVGLRNGGFMKNYWHFVERHGVTLLAAVPTVMASLNNVTQVGPQAATVRALLTGGSPLPNELAAAFERIHGLPVRNILGMTECAGVVSIEPFLGERTPGSCGLPLPFTEVRLVGRSGQIAAADESGILQLRGPNVGPGYTDASRNPGTFDDGWLMTGDIGHVDAQGRVFVTGRSKDVIIRGAHNIDPQVIEEALLQHPAVQLAAAVGEPDEYAGEVPMAFVSLKPSVVVDAAELSAFANARIPERPAYPKRIHVLDAIPVTAVGKVFKPRLRALAYEQVLRERLTTKGIADVVRVTVQDEPQGLVASFRMAAGVDMALREQVVQIMAPFAVSYSIEQGGEA